MNIFKRIFGKSEPNRKCFEEMENVFHNPNEHYNLVFYPLCSLNLNEVIPSRNEWIHFVDIWNNGDIEESFFHAYRTPYQIQFTLKDSKYIYHGDETKFPKFSSLKVWKAEAKEEFLLNRDEYLKIPIPSEFESSKRRKREKEREQIDFDYFLYVDQNISYWVTFERFKKSGNLNTHKSFPKGYKMKKYPLIKQVGGEPNWPQRDMTPKNEQGKPLTFIGQVTGYHYMKNGSDSIFLFLNESTNEVIQIFQYG